ncbi:branched-chain amino acid aminotransferase [Cryobacterium sp. TMT1-62]|uniref:Branched-chain-amino-acid aminotransferase n=1 Tax=Cryobacterium sandaracinum TaxID=1259247 RepID=A0ABY2JIW7_9MICO|nr:MULTISPECIES: branched-chain amino acid aminotransferase [Cryobacterium]TFB53318.1 branched-chain amino acid aminotransferase [Cryobacterium sp. Sr3]TFB58802.1 branched-chain amino acid aminotransferase [Cryobacterium sp. Hz7]TFC34937.1 branched-chain amino acid aminotransferase [Cryobacterium sp. TMT2-14]TFC51464.1 branched-chain amino acid aminotransferase [Cryobacterium sp. TMT2-17-1]TFD06793.1 branched-chain amino acid aminotransferase [Cryobacterium sandaracinum]
MSQPAPPTTSGTATFPLKFSLTPSTAARTKIEREEILVDPGFGKKFTDHMVAIDWTLDAGWHNARVMPYGPLHLDPASSVLHYGQEIFEGLKAYRHADGSIWTFRPEKNAERLQRSARRLALPELSEADFIESIRQLVAVDGDWVPSAAETSLYLRPFMIANESFLGVRAAHQVGYYVIASPAGAYFADGVAPIKIWLSTEYSRAGRGGTGAAKCGGNYAASLLPQMQAYDNGCAQVLFLDGETSSRIDELGGMNVFFVHGTDTLVTPRLTGAILEGVTRDSIIQLARDRGLTVEERDVTLGEWQDGVASGAITEVFACGTAAVVTPISQLKGPNLSIGDPDGPAGQITMALRQELTDIQYGRLPDRHGWLTRLDAPVGPA